VREIVVFSGSAHPTLAADICRHLNVPLSPTRVQRFGNGCLEVQLRANCREADVFVIQPLSRPVDEHLMELLLMLDAARGASASRATAVIPYYAYGRSDKKDAPRISIGGRLVADLLVTAGASRVLTVTLHSPQTHGFFSVPVDHMNALRVFGAHFKGRDLARTVVVSPDLGGAKEASRLARLLNVPVAAGTKRRHDDNRVTIDAIVGDIAGKDVIVLDDEIANGGTVLEALARVRERHGGRIAVACTHGLFTGQAVERLGAHPDIAEIVTTDTVPQEHGDGMPRLHVLSIAPLLAETIRRIHMGASVSRLFDPPDDEERSREEQASGG
jgi:ribose-phosphate pyrophosphokinase